MKLGTIKNGTRDGQLVVVDSLSNTYAAATGIAKTLQEAVDNWDELVGPLQELANKLKGGSISGQSINYEDFMAPLPRAYEWVDGSAYINHVILVRKARGAEPPATLRTDPLVYQGGSGILLSGTDDIPLADESWGCDFESEIAVVLGDTPQGTTKEDANQFIKLLMICNDVSLRNLIPNELQKGFGFFNSKPASAFAPLAVTPDELGDAWQGGRVHLPLHTTYNGKKFGDPNAGPEMHFSFYELVEHISKTRGFTAGTILGSGTVSNEDRSKGSSCLAEQRMIEKIETGEFQTPFMKAGETVEIEMFDKDNKSIFGQISQKVVSP
ncbi:MAG: 2-keto-4-pentenoate hydratase [Zetaproteobacteria bacterium]|nr:2-keto-4-pentenoate hydratase [Pseudobdellovibrionaceae bacterium]